MTAWQVDEAIIGIARRQHGAFSDRQARDAGATHRVIRRRLATGRWVEMDHLVYTLPASPGTWKRQCQAATLALPGAGVSHTSAAALHQLQGFRQGAVHLVVKPGRHRATPLATVHRSSWPRCIAVDGINTVRMADTFFQLAGKVEERRLRSAFEDAVVGHAALLGEMTDRYVELAASRLPGSALVRCLIEDHADGDGPPASELERLLDRLLVQVDGMPPWQCEAPLPGWERGEARVDPLVPAWRLIIEADGRRWHTRLGDFERDRWRENVATAHGYDVLRFTYSRLVHDQAECRGLLEGYASRRPAAA